MPVIRLLTLAALLLLGAAPAAAQARLAWPRVAFTPFAGYQFSWVQSGIASVDLNGRTMTGSFDSRNDGGPAAGVRFALPIESLLQVPAPTGIGVVGGLTFARNEGGTTRLVLRDDQSDRETSVASPLVSSDILTAKLGLGLRVPVPLPTDLTIAPTLIHVMPRHRAAGPLDRDNPVSFAGLNLGLDTSLPTYVPGLLVQFGVEDYIMYATGELEDRVERYFAMGGNRSRARLPRKPSHLVMLRAGLSVQF